MTFARVLLFAILRCTGSLNNQQQDSMTKILLVLVSMSRTFIIDNGLYIPVFMDPVREDVWIPRGYKTIFGHKVLMSTKREAYVGNQYKTGLPFY